MLKGKRKKIGNLEGTGLYAAPLTRSTTQTGSTTLNRFVFDVGTVGKSLQLDQLKEQKTILLVGAADPGKTSLIDSLFNFIVGVDWNDPFCFLLREDGQEDAESISVYEIRHANGFRIPFSLTIIDVSVDTPSKDFSELLVNFFQSDAIQQLDLIEYVAPKNSVHTPSCQSVLSHFGKDLEENFHHIDVDCSETNYFQDSAHRQEFQNAGFSADGPNTPSLSRNQWKSLEEFFKYLAKIKPKEISQTKQVLEERKRLEVTFGELRKLVEKGTALRDKMEQLEKIIADFQVKIKANKNVKTTRETKLPSGFLATNCNNCGVTCSVHQSSDIGGHASRTCSVCPEKCDWNLHSINVSYVLQSTIENVPPDAEEVKNIETRSKILKKLIDEEKSNSMDLEVLRFQLAVYIRGVDSIALCPFVTTPEYADLLA